MLCTEIKYVIQEIHLKSCIKFRTNFISTGSSGVVREGLSHMAIPRGWGWGGMVSDHCPIYCDLYTEVVNAVNCDKNSASDAVSTTVNISDSNCNQDS